MTSMTTPIDIRQAVHGGIDTHKATHHAAVITEDGHLVGQRQFATTTAGCRALLAWLGQWQVHRVGVEQTGTYGAGITRELTAAGYQVVEVNQPDLRVRAMAGKSDPIDAIMAAEAARTGRASAVPKHRCGAIESIRLLHTARRSAVKERSALLNQIGAMAITVPTPLRDRLGRTNRQIAAQSLRLRPNHSQPGDPTHAARIALRSLAERIHDLDRRIQRLDTDLDTLLASTAPRLLARPYVGTHAAAQLLITAGENIDRITSEAKFARLTGTAPIPASSGQTHRMRLHRGGDRAANSAIHLVAVGRLRSHQPAIDYLARRTSEGLSKKDAIRAMKRLITRELFGALKADLKALDAI